MKFKIVRSNFFKTLSHLQGIVDKKNSLPSLSNILIEARDNALTLSSTDMDISIIERIDCNVFEEGATTINSQILYNEPQGLNTEKELPTLNKNSFKQGVYY